jgi:hypothetical protein
MAVVGKDCKVSIPILGLLAGRHNDRIWRDAPWIGGLCWGRIEEKCWDEKHELLFGGREKRKKRKADGCCVYCALALGLAVAGSRQRLSRRNAATCLEFLNYLPTISYSVSIA